MKNSFFKSHQSVITAILISFLLLFMPVWAHAAESLCAEVKLEIKQELSLERQAFMAHMRINNGLTTIALEDVGIVVNFTDGDGNPVVATFDPDADPETTGAKFFITVDSMENINDVDGNGTVSPSTSADIYWMIIPVPGAADGQAQGKLYYVGATLTYDLGGEEHITEVTPDYIYVKPLPDLRLDYFIPEQVYGDDAFTTEIEPSIPFSLGLRVKNIGVGTAYNLKVDSAQPKITENNQGLLIGFAIEGSEVNGEPVTDSLLADFGNIAPNTAGVARWIMTCTLSGTFQDFTASISHSDELGGELTSLIKEENLHTYLMEQDVLVDLPGRDDIRDFLAYDGTTLKVFESDSDDSEVPDVSASATMTYTGVQGSELYYTLSFTATTGFGYVKITDPQSGDLVLKSVVRSDGKNIKDENCWLSKKRKEDPEDGWDYYLSLFDIDATGSYTITFDDAGTLPQAPVLAFIPDRTGIEDQNLSFLVEASDPNATIPALSAASMPVGAGFTDQGTGSGVFDWTPGQGQAGTYNITFKASDGALVATRRAKLTIYPYDDTDGDGMMDDWEMANFGTLDRDGTGDYDGDGIPDYLEFILGTDPTAEDNAPSTPVILSPAQGDETTTQSPALVIENSMDPEENTLTYEFDVFTDEGLSELITSEQGVAEGTGTTSWTVPVSLSDNISYTWRVRAFDGAAYSLWAYGSFFVNTSNDTPQAPNFSYPSENSEVSVQTPLLQVSAAADPDRDTLSYIFEVYDDSSMTTLVTTGNGTESGNMINWTLDQALTDNTDYYFRALVQDEHGAQNQTSLAMFHVNTANHAPGDVVVVSPASGSETGEAPELEVQNAIDDDGDALSYIFEVDTSPMFDSAEKIVSDPIAQEDITTSFQVSGLDDNTRYYFRVKATDTMAESMWAYGEFFVNSGNDVPGQVKVKNPGQKAWVSVLTPELSIAPMEDPDGDDLVYVFEIYGDQDLTDLVAQGQSSEPTWTVPGDLSDKTRYFWQAHAVDNEGMSGDNSEPAEFFVKESETPSFVQVSLSTSNGDLLSGITIYAFTSADAYTGINAATDENGIAEFLPEDFSDGDYKFRAGYMGNQFWSQDITIPGTYTADIVISMETVSINVHTAAGAAANVKVYVFTEAGSYLSLNSTTDENGDVTFKLPSGFSYQFRADIMGSQYWIGPVAVDAGGANAFNIDAGGGIFNITVQEDASTPMQDVRVYLFHENGSYLNLNALTDAQGKVAFDVPEGTYRVRADYLGYQFFSSDTEILTSTDIDLDIPHTDVAITVNSVFQSVDTPLENIPVYLFTGQGTYMNQSIATDAVGQVIFHLPAKEYKVRADYMTYPFWSETFISQDVDIDIAMADAEVSVGWGSFFLEDLPVYAFTTAGTYLNLNSLTDSDGNVVFHLPAVGEYKFRANYQAGQYFSDDTTLIADEVNAVDITTGGGTFVFTVLKGVDDPLVGVNCHVFSESGTYFGVYGPTSSDGEVSFDLADGNYNIRVDYLGYQFWNASPYSVPDILSDEFTILHQDVTITVNGSYQSVPEPLENIPLYLFTDTGSYMNQTLNSDTSGQALFNLPDQSYKVRADYLNQQYWTDPLVQEDKTITISMADALVTVTGNGQALLEVPVYVFTADETYLNINTLTDTSGQVSFRLPAGSYKFRADYQNSQYWTDVEVLISDQENSVDISTGGGTFAFTVMKGVDDPLQGVTCYVFTDTDTYLNMNATTSSEGQVSFDLPDGAYKFRVDHLGYQFWTDTYTVPTTLSDTFTIAHQDVTLSVNTGYQGATESLEGVPVYLYTEAGTYMNQTLTTDVNGQVVFNLPDQSYKVRTDYRNQQFWSDPFVHEDKTITIPMAEALITVTGGGQSLEGVPVYVYTGSGTYLNMNQATDASGQVSFSLPSGAYKFRTDYLSNQYWSDEETLIADQSNAITISTGGGAFTLTVMKNATDPLTGISCYVFSEAGSYLGLSGTTDSSGQIVFNLADGTYKYRVNHLGYQFWTDIYEVPTILSDIFTVLHQDITITVNSLYQAPTPMSGITVYLFTGAGSYMSQNQTTDANGQVVFNLPDQEYKVRADYLGYQYWSDTFQSLDASIVINHGLARIHAHRSGTDQAGARVYLYTASGSYMNWYEDTDVTGYAEFLIPNQAYKFRVDEGGDQVWSSEITVTPGVETELEVDLD